MIKKHVRKNQDQPQGEIVEREGTIHWSSVMHAERYVENHKIDSPETSSEKPTETEE
jgi:ribosomal protein L24